MLNYIGVLVRKRLRHMSRRAVAEELGYIKSGVNDFLTRFEECPDMTFPLPGGITNEAIHEAVYSKRPSSIPEADICFPDPAKSAENLRCPNMTLIYQ